MSEEDRGVSSVVNHIGVAEKHFENGKLGDDYLFNDVVYRSNQAFEGALKEAYRIITGRNPDKKTPQEIEKYFAENSLLKDRVLQLFTNYRTEWRNKSTHDYKLYFSEQEAFLAIVSISAFINILFDQMLEKRAYDKEIQELNNTSAKPVINIAGSIEERVVDLLLSYSKEVPNKMTGSSLPRITEVELIGSFYAYLNNFAKDIEVFSEYLIKAGPQRYIADFFLQKDTAKLIIEFKNPMRRNISDSLNGGTHQLFTYLISSGVEYGILYIPPTSEGQEMEVVTLPIETNTGRHKVIQIYPKGTFNNIALSATISTD